MDVASAHEADSHCGLPCVAFFLTSALGMDVYSARQVYNWSTVKTVVKAVAMVAVPFHKIK